MVDWFACLCLIVVVCLGLLFAVFYSGYLDWFGLVPSFVCCCGFAVMIGWLAFSCGLIDLGVIAWADCYLLVGALRGDALLFDCAVWVCFWLYA